MRMRKQIENKRPETFEKKLKRFMEESNEKQKGIICRSSKNERERRKRLSTHGKERAFEII